MAYAFDRIDTLLRRRNADGDNESRNIAPVVSYNAATTSGMVPQKASRIGGRYSKAAAGSAATEALKDKVKVPGFLGTVSGDISKSYSSIDKNVEDYTKREKDLNEKTYKPINTELANRAASGDEGAFSRIRNVLSDTTGRDISRPEFKLPNVTKIPDVGTRSGLEQLYRTGRKPTYTKGMAEFDVNLAQGTRGLSDKISKLAAEQNKLLPYARDKYKTAFEEAQKNNLDSLEAAKKSISSYLSEEEGKLTEAQKEEAERLTKDLEDIYARKGRRIESLKKEYQDFMRNKKNELEKKSIEASRRFIPRSEDKYISDYISNLPYKRGTTSESPTSPFHYKNVFNKDEAARYNRIMKLLGKVDRVSENSPINFNDIKANPELLKSLSRDKARELIDKLNSEMEDRYKDLEDVYEPLDWATPSIIEDDKKAIADALIDAGHIPELRDWIASLWNDEQNQNYIRSQLKKAGAYRDIIKYTNAGMSFPEAIRQLDDQYIAKFISNRLSRYKPGSIMDPTEETSLIMRKLNEAKRYGAMSESDWKHYNALADELGIQRKGDYWGRHLTGDEILRALKVLANRKYNE